MYIIYVFTLLTCLGALLTQSTPAVLVLSNYTSTLLTFSTLFRQPSCVLSVLSLFSSASPVIFGKFILSLVSYYMQLYFIYHVLVIRYFNDQIILSLLIINSTILTFYLLRSSLYLLIAFASFSFFVSGSTLAVLLPLYKPHSVQFQLTSHCSSLINYKFYLPYFLITSLWQCLHQCPNHVSTVFPHQIQIPTVKPITS